jgi:hypothetical protein
MEVDEVDDATCAEAMTSEHPIRQVPQSAAQHQTEGQPSRKPGMPEGGDDDQTCHRD